MAGLVETPGYARPAESSARDPIVGYDELGREIRKTFLGAQYAATDIVPVRGRDAGDRGMMYNLLDNIIGFDDGVMTPGENLGAGIQGFASGLLSDPVGTGADIFRGGYEGIERAMAPGATPMDAVEAAGMAMGVGGLFARPAGSVGMGGRVAASAADTPAAQVARLLRDGRASEVTDDLMAQADPQEMYQLYVSGQTGMDMPLDEASRMARAAEMGFGNNSYHGTDTDIQAFDPRLFGRNDQGWYGRGVTTDTDPDVASGYANYREPEAGQNVLPVVSRGRYMQWPEGQDPFPNVDDARAGTRDIQGLGYDGTRMTNDRDLYGVMPDWGTEQVTFDPANIRSRFARFDPRLSHLSNLNAANADPITGLLAAQAGGEQEPLANLRDYVSRYSLLAQ